MEERKTFNRFNDFGAISLAGAECLINVIDHRRKLILELTSLLIIQLYSTAVDEVAHIQSIKMKVLLPPHIHSSRVLERKNMLLIPKDILFNGGFGPVVGIIFCLTVTD